MTCLNEKLREAGWLPAYCQCEKCEAIRDRQHYEAETARLAREAKKRGEKRFVVVEREMSRMFRPRTPTPRFPSPYRWK